MFSCWLPVDASWPAVEQNKQTGYGEECRILGLGDDRDSGILGRLGAHRGLEQFPNEACSGNRRSSRAVRPFEETFPDICLSIFLILGDIARNFFNSKAVT
ncbi:hypothetical protein CEXT_336211 [Caerostris extrusa]|uniref:Uncharacterized protein n=1 Tax=Caerostris extrusa TaxID=172846 RepID=A0AAV4Q0M4_CAEEX|nr:hypothetical protein CEXT_336211 [Caerostris extrusa]